MTLNKLYTQLAAPIFFLVACLLDPFDDQNLDFSVCEIHLGMKATDIPKTFVDRTLVLGEFSRIQFKDGEACSGKIAVSLQIRMAHVIRVFVTEYGYCLSDICIGDKYKTHRKKLSRLEIVAGLETGKHFSFKLSENTRVHLDVNEIDTLCFNPRKADDPPARYPVHCEAHLDEIKIAKIEFRSF